MECNVCGGKRYVCIDGFYYCAVCSTQSQTQVEYLAEETLRKSHLCEEVKTKDERCTSDQGAVTAPSELTFFSEMLCEQSEEVVFYLLLLMLKKSEKQKNHENDDEELSEALSVMAM
ncbi:unnamed protein product [Soboliphyme baturini]|uniref:TATA box-binding protein-associated factor RNA polymerase I subunit B n=1 Tax=Soboliphyme baturini TaxID=241478 RepID=A0A183IP08_9BILA|nr:unnamed protein product [Soboliphyme baturini]